VDDPVVLAGRLLLPVLLVDHQLRRFEQGLTEQPDDTGHRRQPQPFVARRERQRDQQQRAEEQHQQDHVPRR